METRQQLGGRRRVPLARLHPSPPRWWGSPEIDPDPLGGWSGVFPIPPALGTTHAVGMDFLADAAVDVVLNPLTVIGFLLASLLLISGAAARLIELCDGFGAGRVSR